VGSVLAARDEFVEGLFPAISEYLTRRVVEGKVIETATLLLFAEEGQWKVCLNDRDGGVVLFRGGLTVSDALGGLEKALVEGTADWRERKAQGRR
jgi:hypothetical protein